MIDNMQKVNELESELAVKLDLTEREQRLLEALQYMIDKHYESHRAPTRLGNLLKGGKR
jgi:hypothetical protein